MSEQVVEKCHHYWSDSSGQGHWCEFVPGHESAERDEHWCRCNKWKVRPSQEDPIKSITLSGDELKALRTLIEDVRDGPEVQRVQAVVRAGSGQHPPSIPVISSIEETTRGQGMTQQPLSKEFRAGAAEEARLMYKGMRPDTKRMFDFVREVARRGDSPREVTRLTALVYTADWTWQERLSLAFKIVIPLRKQRRYTLQWPIKRGSNAARRSGDIPIDPPTKGENVATNAALFSHQDMKDLLTRHELNFAQQEAQRAFANLAQKNAYVLSQVTPGPLRDAAALAISDALMACNRAVSVDGMDIL